MRADWWTAGASPASGCEMMPSAQHFVLITVWGLHLGRCTHMLCHSQPLPSHSRFLTSNSCSAQRELSAATSEVALQREALRREQDGLERRADALQQVWRCVIGSLYGPTWRVPCAAMLLYCMHARRSIPPVDSPSHRNFHPGPRRSFLCARLPWTIASSA